MWKKRRWEGKEKLFALFVPKFDKVCADAKAPPGLMGILGKAGVARRRSSSAGSRRGKRKGREGDPRAREGGTETVTLHRPCRAAWTCSVPGFLFPSSSYRFLRGSGWNEL